MFRTVRRAITGPDELIEDACSFAWVQLIEAQPERRVGVHSWLITVTIHEAFRLSRLEQRATTSGGFAAARPTDPNS